MVLFDGVKFLVAGKLDRSVAKFRAAVVAEGAEYTTSIKKATHVVSTADHVGKGVDDKVTQALADGLPVVSVEWVDDSVKGGRLCAVAKYELGKKKKTATTSRGRKRTNSPSPAPAAAAAGTAASARPKRGRKASNSPSPAPAAPAPTASKRGRKRPGSPSPAAAPAPAPAPTPTPAPAPAPAPASKRARKGKGPATTTAPAAPAATNTAAAAAAATAAPPTSMTKVKLLKKGRAVVDSGCPDHEKYHVFEEGDDVWDATLNQTNIQNNNNKFYLMQVLQEDLGGRFFVFFKWGRVGAQTPQKALMGPYPAVAAAKQIFEKKFRDKSGNAFANRHNFKHCSGKYDLVLVDYNEETDEERQRREAKEAAIEAKRAGGAGGAGGSGSGSGVAGGQQRQKEEKKKQPQKRASALHEAVQQLVAMITNVRTFEAVALSMEYDVKKAPLGKLKAAQVRHGYEALKKIETLIRNGMAGSGQLEQACNEFYTRIPHAFGMRRPPLIASLAAVQSKVEMLDALADIQVAMSMMEEDAAAAADVHPIDQQYLKLNAQIQVVPRDGGGSSGEFAWISQYLSNGHAPTHNAYKLELCELFRVDRAGEADKFHRHLHNRHLLWHGSRATNFCGILSQGLRIAPPEAPVTGYMFGKGVYFADMVSKSANYCFTSRSNPEGLLLLCEVALGTPHELAHSDCNLSAAKLPANTHSTKGCGATYPDPKVTKVIDDGVVVPLGKYTKSDKRGSLLYNEFIVYNTDQVRIRYMLKVRFNYR